MILELLVSGLCAVVRESCTTGAAQGVHVLMMQAPKTKHAHQRTTGKHEHLPRLIVDVRDLVPAGDDANAPDEIMEIPDGTQLAIWRLEGYRIEFDPQPPPIRIFEGRRDPRDVLPTKFSPPEDLSWVPELHRASKEETLRDAKAKPEIRSEPTLLPDYVSARLTRLKVARSDDKNTDSWMEADFDDESKEQSFEFHGKYQQALADRVKITLKFGQDEVKIRLAPVGKDLEERFIQVRPHKQKLGTARVMLSNFANRIESYKKGDPLAHFALYGPVLVDSSKLTIPKFTQARPVKCTITSACIAP